jgi:hypothetical protein
VLCGKEIAVTPGGDSMGAVLRGLPGDAGAGAHWVTDHHVNVIVGAPK